MCVHEAGCYTAQLKATLRPIGDNWCTGCPGGGAAEVATSILISRAHSAPSRPQTLLQGLRLSDKRDHITSSHCL